MFGLRRPHYRASAIFGVCTGLNILTFFKLINWNLNKYLTIFLIVAWVCLHMVYFVNPKRHKKIFSKYLYASFKAKILGIILSLIYIFLSIFIYIKVSI
jgi:hypothetical protein